MRTFIAILLIAQTAAWAQQSGSKKSFKFEANSQLVVVNVSVKDKSGALLNGLKAADFTVAEDGKPQEIKVFEFQRLNNTALPPPDPIAASEANAAPPASPVKVPNTIAPAKAGEVKYK